MAVLIVEDTRNTTRIIHVYRQSWNVNEYANWNKPLYQLSNVLSLRLTYIPRTLINNQVHLFNARNLVPSRKHLTSLILSCSTKN